MLDWIPLDPFIDIGVRHGVDRLPISLGYGVLLLWNIWKWEKQKVHGARRDAKDREQDARLDILEGKEPPMDMQWVHSPNYTKTRFFQKVDKIVCHWINGDLAVADGAFSRSNTEVSAHFAVQDNTVHQYVDVGNTAWHSGNWVVNLHSVGIEHAGSPTLPVSDATYATSAKLISKLCNDLGLTLTRDLLHKHNEFKATACPGTLDLDRLYKEAYAIWNPQPVNVPVVAADLAGNPTPTVTSHFEPFTTDLQPAQTYRAEARRVQEFLVSKGFMARPGDNEWGYYGKKTQTAVDKFQKANGIPTASQFGWWYPLTRSKANQQV